MGISTLVRYICNSCLAWQPPNVSPGGAKTSIVNVKTTDQLFEAQIHVKTWSCLEDFHIKYLFEPILLYLTMGDNSQKSQLCQPLTLSNTNLPEFPHSTMQYVSRWFLY